jgi:hypothetical protein
MYASGMTTPQTSAQKPTYFDTLVAWAATREDMKVEAMYNDIAWFVTIRRDDGLSATGTHPTDRDAATRSAAHLFNIEKAR